MWSKRRQEAQKQAVTSFRSKITRRKRKLSQSRVATPTQNSDFLTAGRLVISNGDLELANSENPNFTISRSNSISRSSSFSYKTPTGELKQNTTLPAQEDMNYKCMKDERNMKNNSFNTKNNHIKRTSASGIILNLDTDEGFLDDSIFSPPARYSDSYIPSKFNYVNQQYQKSPKHLTGDNKRYDAIGANQPQASPPMRVNRGPATNFSNAAVCADDANMQYGVREKANAAPAVESKRSVKKQKKHGKNKATEAVKKTEAAPVTVMDNTNLSVKKSTDSNSYLKRVKSKIYKSRSDDSDNTSSVSNNKTKSKKKSPGKINPPQFVQHTIPRICENIVDDEFGSDVQLRNSDFPLFFRQTSNLERIRPRTFGLRTSASNIGISDLVDSATNLLKLPLEKPKLIKSKSSSAINLNLLRTRRSKLQEQAKQSTKNADVEFKFVSFNPHVNETTSVIVNRKFGPNNPIIVDVDEVPVKQNERPASWTYDLAKNKGIFF